MKLFVWANPYDVEYGSSLLFAVAATVEEARELASSAPGYEYGKFDAFPSGGRRADTLGEPTRVVELPCAEWHEWSE